MKIEIFDDFYSIFHIVFGAITILFGLWVFVIFISYQVIEYCMKRGKDEIVGDMVEYVFGSGVMALCSISLR
ncbi:MAG: hypothetical protein QXJ45_06915 [Thermoproteota archaeon]